MSCFLAHRTYSLIINAKTINLLDKYVTDILAHILDLKNMVASTAACVWTYLLISKIAKIMFFVKHVINSS